MGFDVDTFHYILQSFKPVWDGTTIPQFNSMGVGPRPLRCSLDAAGGLGLALHFLILTMQDRSLVQIFAIILATASRYIRFSLTILAKTLIQIPEAQIRWPAPEDFAQLNELIIECHPLLTSCMFDDAVGGVLAQVPGCSLLPE
jgi:hypothetical protein